MAYVLVCSSVPRSADRYLVAREPDGYVVVLVTGRPSSYHRHEASAFAWIARRELDAAQKKGEALAGCFAFVFANERGERRTIVGGIRQAPSLFDAAIPPSATVVAH